MAAGVRDCPVNKVFHAIRKELLDIDEMLHWYTAKELKEVGLDQAEGVEK